VTIADVHEAQSNFDLAQAELIAAESALDIAGDSLARIVGGPPGELALLREEVAFTAPQPADPQRWVDSATQGSLSVHVGRCSRNLPLATWNMRAPVICRRLIWLRAMGLRIARAVPTVRATMPACLGWNSICLCMP